MIRNQQMGLPHSSEPTLLMEEIMEHWHNRQAKKMTRLEYLEGLETLILARESVGSFRDGKHVRIASQWLADDMREHRPTTVSMTVWELAGMMDAQDAEHTAAQTEDEGR